MCRHRQGVFYNLENRPTDYLVLFRMLMEKYAADQNKKYWLQKVNPYDGEKCVSNYPDASFIIIKRNIVDVIRSSVKMKTAKYAGTRKNLAKEVFFYVFQEKILHSIKARCCYCTRFEDLKNNLENEVKNICDSLELNYDPSMLEQRFKPNTSFKQDTERQKILSPLEIFLVKIFYGFSRLFPICVFRAVHKAMKKDTARFIPGTFGFIKDKYGINIQQSTSRK